ncbi:MAG: FkbM family methyltransferase [Actinobacteria bacterium]|nr:FkbM family methyltransferase [Actinomycetota bacterium]
MQSELEKMYSNVSYSQEGEDLILARIFERKQVGFYIDIGAYHPIRFSNSHLFYTKGWSGINIDAMPGSMKIFNELRPRDINIEAAISNKIEELEYFSFNEGALNTFSRELAISRATIENYFILSELKIQTQRLSDILDEHLPVNQPIDFLSVDTEGFDLNILKSNNWEKYSPQIVIAEDLQKEQNQFMSSELFLYMQSLNYTFFAKTFNSFFFKRNN